MSEVVDFFFELFVSVGLVKVLKAVVGTLRPGEDTADTHGQTLS